MAQHGTESLGILVETCGEADGVGQAQPGDRKLDREARIAGHGRRGRWHAHTLRQKGDGEIVCGLRLQGAQDRPTEAGQEAHGRFNGR